MRTITEPTTIRLSLQTKALLEKRAALEESTVSTVAARVLSLALKRWDRTNTAPAANHRDER